MVATQPKLFTPRGTILQGLVQTTKVATRGWLLQGADERDKENEWGWGG